MLCDMRVPEQEQERAERRRTVVDRRRRPLVWEFAVRSEQVRNDNVAWWAANSCRLAGQVPVGGGSTRVCLRGCRNNRAFLTIYALQRAANCCVRRHAYLQVTIPISMGK